MTAPELEAELESLRRWKAEASEVLAGWDAVWEALGRPGKLGSVRSVACVMEIERRSRKQEA